MALTYLFHAPAYVVFGRDSRKNIGALLKRWGAKGNVLVVHGQNIKSSGLAIDIMESITQNDLTPLVFDKVLPDAPVEVVREGVAFAKKQHISAVIAIGGGSAMDMAKAISVMLDNPGDILDYAGADKLICRRSTLLFTLPTTCGTGSEITDGGVIYDAATQRKYAVWDVFSGPDVSILDPYMLDSLSPEMIAQTAMDAMAHSVEGYTSRLANPMTDALALGAIRLIYENVEKACTKTDEEALEKVLTASTMAGISFNRSGVHAGHSIAHALGALGHIHHGTACAIALPHVVEMQAKAIPQKVADVGRALGANIPETANPTEIGALAAAAIAALNEKLHITKLSHYGIKADILDAAVSYAVAEGIQARAFVPSEARSLEAYLRSVL